MNKYKQWYSNITDRAKNRNLNSYTESHHIQPRSLGGTDESINLVALTAREHFICHWLLVKMTTGKDRHKMLNALRMMRAEKSGQERYNTKITWSDNPEIVIPLTFDILPCQTTDYK